MQHCCTAWSIIKILHHVHTHVLSNVLSNSKEKQCRQSNQLSTIQHTANSFIIHYTSMLTRPELNSLKLANASFFFDDTDDEPLRWPPANGSLSSNTSRPPGTEPPAGFGAGGRGGAGARLCCFGGSCGGSEAVKLRDGKLSALVPPAGINNPVPNGSLGWKYHQITTF